MRGALMLDAVRGYLQLASGLTEVTMRKARDVAQSLLSGDIDGVVAGKDAAADAAKAMGSQVQDLADDIVAQATANRELLIGLIRTELDRAAGRMGFVREEELAAVRRTVARLEDQVHALREDLAPAAGKRAPAKKTAAKPRKKVPAGTRAKAAAPQQPAADSGQSS
jgi:polyhydroxyalkanoate synthesis regulator phasin